MNANKSYGFGTRSIHAGHNKDAYGALCTPVYRTSTFEFKSCQHGADIFAGKELGFAYSRTGNPTVAEVEAKLANLEGGEAAIATASGMGAITAAIWTLIKSGDRIVADQTLYGCTFEFLSRHLPQLGVDVVFIDCSDEAQLKAALTDNTRIVYLETPANPNLKITDIRKVAGMVHGFKPEIKVICDNTFCSPFVQRPLELGADIVVHSATKYINGHGDLLAGFIITDADTINEMRVKGIKDMTGAMMQADEAALVIRGLKTLPLRMRQHCASAMEIAKFLESSDKIEKVFYPGLESFEGHETAASQMDYFGGMLSFIVKGGRAAASKLCDSLELCTLAVSLGDAETLIEHPASMTHSTYTAEELKEAGIDEGLVRLSVGLEDTEDLIDDFRQALEKI